jgi:hypothetical protein
MQEREKRNRCLLEHKAKWCMQKGNRTDDGAAIYSEVIPYFQWHRKKKESPNKGLMP